MQPVLLCKAVRSDYDPSGYEAGALTSSSVTQCVQLVLHSPLTTFEKKLSGMFI